LCVGGCAQSEVIWSEFLAAVQEKGNTEIQTVEQLKAITHRGAEEGGTVSGDHMCKQQGQTVKSGSWSTWHVVCLCAFWAWGGHRARRSRRAVWM
jgi:hypothetical protein